MRQLESKVLLEDELPQAKAERVVNFYEGDSSILESIHKSEMTEITLPKLKKSKQVSPQNKNKIYFKSLEAAIPFYQVAKTKLAADRYVPPEKVNSILQLKAKKKNQ